MTLTRIVKKKRRKTKQTHTRQTESCNFAPSTSSVFHRDLISLLTSAAGQPQTPISFPVAGNKRKSKENIRPLRALLPVSFLYGENCFLWRIFQTQQLVGWAQKAEEYSLRKKKKGKEKRKRKKKSKRATSLSDPRPLSFISIC